MAPVPIRGAHTFAIGMTTAAGFLVPGHAMVICVFIDFTLKLITRDVPIDKNNVVNNSGSCN